MISRSVYLKSYYLTSLHFTRPRRRDAERSIVLLPNISSVGSRSLYCQPIVLVLAERFCARIFFPRSADANNMCKYSLGATKLSRTRECFTMFYVDPDTRVVEYCQRSVKNNTKSLFETSALAANSMT